MVRSTSAMEESITASLNTFKTLASVFTVLSFFFGGGEEEEVGISFYPHLELWVPWRPWVGLPRTYYRREYPQHPELSLL